MTVTTAEQIAALFPDAPVGKVVIGKINDRGSYPVTIGRRKPKHFYISPVEVPEMHLTLTALMAEAMTPEQRAEFLVRVEAAVNPVRKPRKPRAVKPGAPSAS